MNKKILSLDLGITSIGYSVIEEFDNDRYSLLDYGVSMFDKATDKDGNSKKILHSQSESSSKLFNLRKQRKKDLSILFDNFKLANKDKLLIQEKQNIYKNKWQLRCVKAFEQKLSINELFTIFYTIAKHRGYKSLESSDLLDELCEELNIPLEITKSNKNEDEKGKIKKSLKNVEELKQNSNKTVASIIYDIEIQKNNPTFRNHDNYNYMIRREYIEEEIINIVKSQVKFGLFESSFNSDIFIQKLKDIITYQNPSTNDMSLFGDCEFYPQFKVANQYSIISDIYKMYQSVSNITFNSKPTIKITKEQINLVANDFFTKLKKGKNILDLKYKDIRKILNLSDDIKIFNKDDDYISKGKKVHHTITKFHFINNLSKFDTNFIINNLSNENGYKNLKEIFEALQFEKDPTEIYKKLKDKIEDNQTIIYLIKYKSGNSLNISAEAMIKFIPYFKDGYTTDEIKEKLKLNRSEDYSEFKKGIKYLHINQFEKDNNNLKITNHPVKYVVSATLRVVKHLHNVYGSFDEIRVESTRELSQNEETKKAIEKANRELEKQIDTIVQNNEYQIIAKQYGKNLQKYARKILMYESQDRRDIYTGKGIEFKDIFTNTVDLDHIVPQSLGGLSVKHNFVLVHKDTNIQKSNQLPLNFVKDKEDFINRVEYLFAEHKINWKMKKNLLSNSLEETYKDTFESKSLRATSYIEALTAQVLKRYYPFKDIKKQKDGSSVRHIQGRATSNIRKILKVKTKIRDTNIHHAIDAILIGMTNQSWLKKLSDTFKNNMGVIDDKARANIKKDIPIFEIIINNEVKYLEPKELVNLIEDNYNFDGENSIFYKDIWGKTKSINFWVSKKPMVSKIHKDTIYSKKDNGIYTVRESIINHFINLKITPTTLSKKFEEEFNKKILNKMYLYKTNPNDIIYKIVQQRANDIKVLLDSFMLEDTKDKETLSILKTNLDNLIHSDLLDNNNNIIKKVKFYQTNLTGFNVRGGLATKEKTFIGFKATLENDKLNYTRIDVANIDKIKKDNDNSFKVYKNDLVFFVYPDKSYKGGKIVSFLEDKKIGAFQNPRFPATIQFQPFNFCKLGSGKKVGTKQQALAQTIGIIKLNLDILGNIKSYQKIGQCNSDILEHIKTIKG